MAQRQPLSARCCTVTGPNPPGCKGFLPSHPTAAPCSRAAAVTSTGPAPGVQGGRQPLGRMLLMRYGQVCGARWSCPGSTHREPPAVLHASRGRTSSLAAACTKALNAKSGGRSHQQQTPRTSPPSTPAAPASRARGDTWAQCARLCEPQGPAHHLLWAQTLCHGERGCSPHTRILSRYESHQ